MVLVLCINSRSYFCGHFFVFARSIWGIDPLHHSTFPPLLFINWHIFYYLAIFIKVHLVFKHTMPTNLWYFISLCLVILVTIYLSKFAALMIMFGLLWIRTCVLVDLQCPMEQWLVDSSAWTPVDYQGVPQGKSRLFADWGSIEGHMDGCKVIHKLIQHAGSQLHVMWSNQWKCWRYVLHVRFGGALLTADAFWTCQM